MMPASDAPRWPESRSEVMRYFSSGESIETEWQLWHCSTPRLRRIIRKRARGACKLPMRLSSTAPNLFFEGMIKKVLSKPTRDMRPDLVQGALRMMREMSPEDVAQVQRGMAARPDSVDTLKTINVPTLLVTGDEDPVTGVNEAELMRRHIQGSQLRVIPKASHYSP